MKVEVGNRNGLINLASSDSYHEDCCWFLQVETELRAWVWKADGAYVFKLAIKCSGNQAWLSLPLASQFINTTPNLSLTSMVQ